MRCFTRHELRTISSTWRRGRSSSIASTYQARAATGASSTSPLSSRSQVARRTPLLVVKAP